VGVAERGGTTLAVVLMRAPTSYSREASSLLDWGFRAAPVTAGIAALPDPAGTAAAVAPQATGEPAVPPLAEDGGGVSPLLAFALAATVVAAAFTYWQGHDELGKAQRRPNRNRTRRVIDLRDPPESDGRSGDPSDGQTSRSASPHSSSTRDSRSIFAP
jgi:D-alanyl-D-alanine carboxypeptidase